MSRTDLLGRIARARAQMMLRGHRRLKLELGMETAIELGPDLQAALDWPEIRAWERIVDMEGFTLRPAAD